MALNFPTSPVNGQLYPDPAQPGIGQWRWSTLSGTWEPVPFYIRAQTSAYNDYLWPTTGGLNSQFLKTNGLGGLSWDLPAGAGGGGYAFFEIDTITFDGTQAVFLLTSGGIPLPVGLNAEQLFITLNKILQSPVTDYTYDSATSTITFTTAPSAGVQFDGRYSFPSSGGTVTQVNTGAGLVGGPITSTGTISLLPATVLAIGGVKPDGTTITVAADGTISAPGAIGTISGVVAGNGLTGGGVSGTVTLSVGAGAGLVASPGLLSLSSTGVTPGNYILPSLTIDAEGRITAAVNGTAGAGTVTQVNTGTGLTGGPITSSGTINLSDTTVVPGTYSSASFTVDAQGRITAASSNPVGSGTVTQVNSGPGLQGGPITTSGTLSLTDTGVSAGIYNWATLTIDSQGRITDATDKTAVTSVNADGGITGFTFSGGPITGAGTLTLEGVLDVDSGGTGATNPADARANLGAGTVTSIVVGDGLEPFGATITTAGTLSLRPCAVTVLGGCQPDGITITAGANGILTASSSGVQEIFTGVGLTGGSPIPIVNSGTIALADTVVTPGSYTIANITVDQQGRLTAAANGTAVTQVATGTGLTGGPITTTGTVSLANTAVTPGAYTNANITVDAQGRLTAASSGTVVPFGAVPATSTSAGTVGQLALDATYLYVCRAANTWERIAWDTTPW